MHEGNEKGFRPIWHHIARSLFSFRLVAAKEGSTVGNVLRFCFPTFSGQITFPFTMIIHLHMLFMLSICHTERCLYDIRNQKIWLHKMISNCFCCFEILVVLPSLPKIVFETLFDTLFRFVCAINNRLGESFITNLLTKFIFNFHPKLLVIPSFLLSIANLLTSQSICSIIYIHSCKFLSPSCFLSTVAHLSGISSWWLRINRKICSGIRFRWKLIVVVVPPRIDNGRERIEY
jgi:hypothetical protein